MENYKKQVSLLLNVLPEIAKENRFALHGGTAINLFVRNMPRLSVDIDLTYIPIEDRSTSFENINGALGNIKRRIEKTIPHSKVYHQKKFLKLQIANAEAQIKLEVNQGIRGLIDDPVKIILCNKAQEQFDVFCTIQGVSFGQLYGGKICAALDRQHPRDLFDVKYLLNNEGFTEEIKKGFLFSLFSSKRPILELLFPNYIDQHLVLKNQFEGMAIESFSYEEFEKTRDALFNVIHKKLSREDRNFILNFENATPNWNIYDFAKFPAIQWKLQNLEKLKNNNPDKHLRGINMLKEKLKT